MRVTKREADRCLSRITSEATQQDPKFRSWRAAGQACPGCPGIGARARHVPDVLASVRGPGMSRMVLASVRGPRRELRWQLSEETRTTTFSESTLRGRAKTKRPQRHIRTAHVGCWRVLAFPFARQSRSVVAALGRWRARFKRDAGSGERPRSRWPGCCLRPPEGQTSAWSCAPGRRPSGGKKWTNRSRVN